MSHKFIDDQLWRLSPAQAREALDAFLKTEREEFPKQNIDSIELNYTYDSVASTLRYLADSVKSGHLNDEEQNLWFMRLGYYFGETLCREKPGLSWNLGIPEFAFANHPVISGFVNDEEAAVISICRNVVLAVALDGAPLSRIDNAVKLWFETPVSKRS